MFDSFPEKDYQWRTKFIFLNKKLHVYEIQKKRFCNKHR